MTYDELTNRIKEKKLIETVAEKIIDWVFSEFPDDGEARLRVYDAVADSLQGVVRVLKPFNSGTIVPIIEEQKENENGGN